MEEQRAVRVLTLSTGVVMVYYMMVQYPLADRVIPLDGEKVERDTEDPGARISYSNADRLPRNTRTREIN